MLPHFSGLKRVQRNILKIHYALLRGNKLIFVDLSDDLEDLLQKIKY